LTCSKEVTGCSCGLDAGTVQQLTHLNAERFLGIDKESKP